MYKSAGKESDGKNTIWFGKFEIIQVLLLCILLFPPPTASGDQIFFSEDFENGGQPVEFWTSSKNGTFVENQIGFTSEKVKQGHTAFVIDITFGSATYVYYSIGLPVKIACEDQLEISGAVFVEPISGSAARVGLGANLIYLPYEIFGTGCLTFDNYTSTEGRWMVFRKDLIAATEGSTDARARKTCWGATGEHLGLQMDRIGIFLSGKSGDRVRVYLDDISLSGSLPAMDYASEVQSRWQGYERLFQAQMDTFERAHAAAETAIDALPANLSPFEQRLKSMAMDRLSEIVGAYDYTALRSAGQMTRATHDGIDWRLKQARGIVGNIVAARSGAIKTDRHLLYAIEATRQSVQNVLPSTTLIPGQVEGYLTLEAAPGEFEPVSFAIQAIEPLQGLSVALTPLRFGARSMPPECIDIRVVKCWYQNGIDSISHALQGAEMVKTLVPELLLKDDSLIKVDEVAKENYIKLQGPASTSRYVRISERDTSSKDPVYWTNDQYAVADSDALQPVDIPAGQYKQFWITAHVPEGTPPGEYSGHLILKTAADGQIGKYKFSVNVMPFALRPSPLRHSIYYSGILSDAAHPFSEGTLSSIYKNREQYRAEMRNMLDHGVLSPILFQIIDDPSLVEEALTIRETVGINDDRLYYMGLRTGNSTHPTELEALTEKSARIASLARAYGMKDTYIYGLDEARGDVLLQQREAWKAVRSTGAKVFSAGYNGSLVEEYPYGKRLNLHFDENQGLDVFDFTTFRNNGVLSGFADPRSIWINGKVGDAVNFDGMGTLICADHSSLDLTDNITLAAWIYPTAYPTGYASHLIKKWESGSAGNFALYFFGNTAGGDFKKIRFLAHAGGIWKAVSPDYTIRNLNQWVHIVWTYSSVSGGKLFIDGTDLGGAVGSGSLATNSAALRVGAGFKGRIDELRIFNRVLRPDEIQSEYQLGLAGTRELVGDLKDLQVAAYELDPLEARLQQEIFGHEIFSYANPQVGIEDPEIYRRNYGLRLWKNAYNGAMDFAYQKSMGNIWNDFDHQSFRDHTFTYPTVNGVIDTIAWEGFREGVDDLRYLSTLQDMLARAPASDLSSEARLYLDGLKTGRDVDEADLDDVRDRLRAYALQLWGLRGHWDFNDGQGAVARDGSPWGNHGHLENLSASAWVDGLAQGGLAFDGAGTVRIPDQDALDLRDEISIETWFHPADFVTAYSARPIAKIGDTGDANYVLYFFGNTAGTYRNKLAFYANRGGKFTNASPFFTVPEIRAWYHVVWTYSSTAGGKLYINGVDQGPAVGSGALAVNSADLIVGEKFKGTLDGLTLYARVLTPEDINARFLAVNPVAAAWRFDEGYGAGVSDDSPHQCDCVLVNSDPAGAWVAGVSGTAVSFAQSGDVARCEPVAATDGPSYSIAGWVKAAAAGMSSRHIVQRGSVVAPASGLLLQLYSDDRLYAFQTLNGSLFSVGVSTDFPHDGRFHHVAMVFRHDGANASLKLYLDGVLKDTRTRAGFPDFAPSGSPLKLGGGFFSGELDEFMVYATALNEEEIRALAGRHPNL